MVGMKPYSEDLRTRIVAAVEGGMPKSEAARLFDVSLSSVKRYRGLAANEEPLAPRKGGRPPKTNAALESLLEEDVSRGPYAAVWERAALLRAVSGVALSVSTVRRLLRRLGFSQKTEPGCVRARRVREGGVEGGGLREAREASRFVFVDEMGTNISLSPLYGWSRGGERLCARAPKNWGKNITLLSSMTHRGMGPSVAVEGAATAVVFEAYVEQALVPSLSPGQVGGHGQPLRPQRSKGTGTRRGGGM